MLFNKSEQDTVLKAVTDICGSGICYRSTGWGP